jgi:hypothetical protein
MFGWCGTMWPGWFLWWLLHHGGRPPIPDPDPAPWRTIVRGVIGAIGGIGAVTVFGPMLTNSGLAETALTAAGGGLFLGSIGDTVMAMGKGSAR